MTIDKAIETSTFLVNEKSDTISANEKVAIQLGIEALKRLNKWRQGAAEPNYYLLPGETEE